MLNFSVGPVQMSEEVLSIGAEQIPYFRTQEFSRVLLENEAMLKRFAEAEQDARVVFLTGSGTAAMEASVMNTLSSLDRALVVEGGSFGRRFVQLCEIHGIPYEAIILEAGQPLTAERLASFENEGFTAFLVNLCETSTGVLYDIDLISAFCRRNGCFLVVDAISAFLADPIHMATSGIDVLIVGSQKALALPPGVSSLVLSRNAQNRIANVRAKSLYFDLNTALSDGERGQTPFTPAVGVLLQMHARLSVIERAGLDSEMSRIERQAQDFRLRLAQSDLPFALFTRFPSSSVTSLATRGASARMIFDTLKDEYGIWVCPNGGDLAERVFRVGHLGALKPEDNETLVDALCDMDARGLLGGGIHV